LDSFAVGNRPSFSTASAMRIISIRKANAANEQRDSKATRSLAMFSVREVRPAEGAEDHQG
jgi:hypothetical protein